MTAHRWFETLGMAQPCLDDVVGHREANTYALLLVALLEADQPCTLEAVAQRFEEAGVADADAALSSLKRCRPARPPVYRDGDLYGLDPYDDDLDLWVFRLGLRPPKVPMLRLVTPESEAGEGRPRRQDPAVFRALSRAAERRRAAHAAQLAALSRVLLVPFPARQPEAVALLDVSQRRITTLVGAELDSLAARLAPYDVIGAIEVRPSLAALGYAPGNKRLAELGPPQKTKKVGPRRTIKITTELLLKGSCGITRPFGNPKAMAGYLRHGHLDKLRARLEADAQALYALYEYGRLHGALRLQWGPVDERLPAPWVHLDEPKLYHLMSTAAETRRLLEVVVGPAPAWDDPWANATLASVNEAEPGWLHCLVDVDGWIIDEASVQRARLAPSAR